MEAGWVMGSLVGRSLTALRSRLGLGAGPPPLAIGPVAKQRFLVPLLALSIGLAPMAFGNDDRAIYVGIAPEIPTIYTYTFVLVAIGIIYAATDSRVWRELDFWYPLLVWLLVLGLFAWGFSPRSVSGSVHIVLAAVVFGVGQLAGKRDPASPILAWTFAAIAWLQLFAIGLWAIGLPLRELDGPQPPDVAGRAFGLTGHPGELAKLLFFCAMFVLTLPRRTSAEKWLFRLTMAAIFIGVYFSQSRTGLLSVAVLVAAYTVLESFSAGLRRSHVLMLGTIGFLGLASLPWLIARFSADPAGGARQHVLWVAVELIKDNFWLGVGPNNYVAVGGAIDALTASGVPVHNAFLLSFAELGLIGAALFWFPFMLMATAAVLVLKRTKGGHIAARVLVSSFVGLLLTALTGWGLLQGATLLVMALTFGYFGAQVWDQVAAPKANGSDA
jgi:O-Antigen ligase